jgi:hypothetical protein
MTLVESFRSGKQCRRIDRQTPYLITVEKACLYDSFFGVHFLNLIFPCTHDTPYTVLQMELGVG